jgi:hypothetical protein
MPLVTPERKIASPPGIPMVVPPTTGVTASDAKVNPLPERSIRS